MKARRGGRLAMASAVALSCAALHAEPPLVTIEGGPDPSGQNYEWIVGNSGRKAIVCVEFPHYRAALFFAPQGWKTECTNLTNVGVADEGGMCRATAASAGATIPANGTAAFRMQCAARSSVVGTGTVLIRFADDSTYAVANVRLPQKEPVLDRYLPAIGLGVVAGAFLLYRALATRKTTDVGPA